MGGGLRAGGSWGGGFRGGRVGEGERGLGGRGQGTFQPPCHILHYHMVFALKGLRTTKGQMKRSNLEIDGCNCPNWFTDPQACGLFLFLWNSHP